MTLYAVRHKKCGCLVSSHPARDQSAEIGAKATHPNGDATVTMPLESAAKWPERCKLHAGENSKEQEPLCFEM